MSVKVEVVVSGVGGLMPSCCNIDEFKELLLQNKNTAEKSKWESGFLGDYNTYNSLPLKQEYLFDSTFFGLHGTQVGYLDPLTRLMLEKTFEAIIDAGVNPKDIHGKNIPVLISSTVSETDASFFSAVPSGFGVTGQARSMMANRISYWLHINGTSLSMDANWNSGIHVIQLAMSMIESGTCDEAIIGTSEFAKSACVQKLFKDYGLLSKDGLTRPFDEQADGFSRGDGIVVLYLQRADLAKRNYVSLLHASTIFNGNREGDFPSCDVDMFHDFLKKCYADSQVDPRHIAYLETYGCGLKNIDEAELEAVERVFCKDRDAPLLIGSVKTNIGHTQPVCALMSLIKIIVAMQTGIIPAHLNYNQPNKNIPALTNGKLEVVSKNKEWTGELAAINSIGIGSSYGHIIVRRNKQPKIDIKTDLPLLITYSTRSEEGILKVTNNVKEKSSDLCFNNLVHDVFASNIPNHLYRGYSMKASTDKTDFQYYSGNKPAVWFVYSGMGSQWQTMGRDLMKLPVFAEAIYKCHNTLKSKGVDLLHIITDEDPQIFENILNSFVGIAAIQIGLTDVLSAIGIQPDGIIGHSVGELGCAYADKCLTAEQMILSSYYRGKASLDAELSVGMMAAIGMGYLDLKDSCPSSIDIACHNSANSCTISGPVDDVADYVRDLRNAGTFAKLVNVSNIAYHSRYIKPAAPLLLSYLADLIPEPKARSSKWVSTSVPQSDWETELARTVSPEYLTNNLLSSVLFEETLSFIPENTVAIEIAPHGLLQSILKRALPTKLANVALTRRDTNCLEFLFNSLGQIYLNGVDFNLNPLYPPVPRPVPIGTASLCSFVQWEHGQDWQVHDMEVCFNPTQRTFDINLKTKEYEKLSHNKTNNRIFVPPVLYFGFIYEMINKGGKIQNIMFEDVVFEEHIEIPLLGNASVTILIQPGTGEFEVTNLERAIVTGKIKINNEILHPAQIENKNDVLKICENNFYKELNIKGYEFQNEYKLVSMMNINEDGFEAKTNYTEDWKALINAMMHTHLFYTEESNMNILLPKYIRQINISFDDFEDTTRESTVWFNRVINTLQSNKGIHITDLEYEPLNTVNDIKIENCSIFESLEISKMKTFNSIMRDLNSNTLLRDCQVKYLGLHTQDLTRIDDDRVPCRVGALDFAGTLSTGDRVMGFAQTDLDNCKLTTDPAFVWPVPHDWKMYKVVTVPYAYTLAYYTLFTVAGISKGDVVLVHAGCSEVGQAALHLAYNHGCTVFTTVATDEQKVILKKLMPMICDEHILNSETIHFAHGILQETKGRGVNVILNCLPGQRFQVSRNILDFYSQFIQLGTADLRHNSMGLKMFIPSRSFHAVNGQQLMQLDQEVKLQLHEMVSQGIKNGDVVPIRSKIITHDQVDESLRYLRSSTAMGAAIVQITNINNKKPVVVSNGFIPRLENQDSYLIYPDSQDSWVLLIEWLVKQGAKRIIIANQSKQKNDFINRYLSILMKKYDIELIGTNHNADSLKNAHLLAKEVSLFGSIKEIFIFATRCQEDSHKIFVNIDTAFSQNKQNGRMVCILGTNNDNSYTRQNGFSVCNIMWASGYSLQDVIKNLDIILTNENKTNVLIKSNLVGSTETNGEVDTTEDSMFLPDSLKTLRLLSQNELKVATILQLNSRAPKKLRELPPVFLVPGLSGPHCPNLRQFVGQLMYPVFCVNLPATTLEDDIVAHLAQQILQVQQCKVYRLIGVSWGGILAIEISKHLERLGKKIELQLIDGDPKVIQKFTNVFNKTNAFNMTLLKQLIKIDGKNLENILSSTDISQQQDIVKSLTILKNKIEYCNFYRPLPNQITGPTTVILTNTVSTEVLLDFSEHCTKIQYKEIVTENHCAILQNRFVSDFVNDNLV